MEELQLAAAACGENGGGVGGGARTLHLLLQSRSKPHPSPPTPPPPETNPAQVLGMPALSPTMTQGNVAAWHVKEGDAVGAGTSLADIETDKATMTFENQDDGFVAKLVVPSGAKDVPVGAPVAILVEEADQVAAFANWAPPPGVGPSSVAAADAAKPSPASSSSSPAAAAAAGGGAGGGPMVAANFRLGPAARKALAEAGLSLEDIRAPTGPRGIVTKEDVDAAVAAGTKPAGGRPAAAAAAAASQPAAPTASKPAAAAAAAAAAPPAAAASAAAAAAPAPRRGAGGPRVSYTDVPNSQVRRIIAKRLLESKQQYPALYASADAPLDAVQALRKTLAAQVGWGVGRGSGLLPLWVIPTHSPLPHTHSPQSPNPKIKGRQGLRQRLRRPRRRPRAARRPRRQRRMGRRRRRRRGQRARRRGRRGRDRRGPHHADREGRRQQVAGAGGLVVFRGVVGRWLGGGLCGERSVCLCSW
jgi:hypothetical protein